MGPRDQATQVIRWESFARGLPSGHAVSSVACAVSRPSGAGLAFVCRSDIPRRPGSCSYHRDVAMSPTERLQVLITVKASPEIGRTHGETVCVAGIRLDGDERRWIRLFPVHWQWFWGRQHPKYQVVDI